MKLYRHDNMSLFLEYLNTPWKKDIWFHINSGYLWKLLFLKNFEKFYSKHIYIL